MRTALSFVALVSALPALADGARQLEAHEHGVGTLNIAIDGSTVAMELHAPGADIVGFEYEAESEADLAAIDAAKETLGAPLELFVMPSAAGCAVKSAKVELEGGHDHDDHDEVHGHDAEHDHDKDHDHEDHAEDAHDGEAGHKEFHAEYMLTCNSPDSLTAITLAYFKAFPNAREVEVQVVTSSGAQAFEVEHTAPHLDLGG